METNLGKFNYYRLTDTSDMDSFLSKSRSFKDYLKFMFEEEDQLTGYIKNARDDKDTSDVEFIEHYYFERYSNIALSNTMAEIVLGKPAKLLLLNYGFQELEVSTKSVFTLKTIFDSSSYCNDLIVAVDSNLSDFEEVRTVSTKEINSYAKNNQLKFINKIDSRAYTPCKGDLEIISNEHVSSLKSIYSTDEYFKKLYEHTCKKIRESLTDDVLRHDAREFKVECIEQMKIGLEEFCARYAEKQDPGVESIVKGKRLANN